MEERLKAFADYFEYECKKANNTMNNMTITETKVDIAKIKTDILRDNFYKWYNNGSRYTESILPYLKK